MKNMPDQNEPINVDLGVMVMIPYHRYESLKNVEADKERYAQHIAEHEQNFSGSEAKVQELEAKIQDGETVKDLYEALQEEYTTLKDKYEKLLEDSKKGTPSEALSKSAKKAVPKKSAKKN